ncbi:MAG: M23 family metallopeptidase [Myxococcaceae bacterium]
MRLVVLSLFALAFLAVAPDHETGGGVTTCTGKECGELRGEEMIELPESKSTHEAMERGRRLSQSLFHCNSSSLWQQAGPDFKRNFGTEAQLLAFARKLRSDFGDEVRIIDETTSATGGVRQYKRAGIFTRYARGVEIEWSWDSKDQLISVQAHPATKEAPSPNLDYQVHTRLKPPFEGYWNVLWGGRTIDENAHAAVSDERFALDLLIMRGGRSYDGDGKKNEQYYCYGKNVVAPAPGIVVEVRDGMLDNLPGSVNPSELYGNHVVIDHGGGEFSLFGHLQKGSIAVKKGQLVLAAQVIAKAGNSGVSTEPHLHYQLMDNAEWVKAHGLPTQFVEYLADGRAIDQGEPKRGQVIGRK